MTRTPKIFKINKYWARTHDFCVEKISTKPSESYSGNWIFGECVEKISTNPGYDSDGFSTICQQGLITLKMDY